MRITRFAALLAAFLILSLDLKAQNKPISQMDTVVVFTDSMFVPIVDPGEALAVNRNKRFFIRQLDGRYQLKNSNLTSLAGLSANGNLKKIDNGLITADTLNLKADTLIAETQLFFRGDSLIKVIQDNSSALNVVGNVNNRVLTATGADSIQGEGNFTFDGTTLALTGTQNVTGQLNVDNLRMRTEVISLNTEDGSDSITLFISGGGSNGRFRGGTISLYGNEAPIRPGAIQLFPGNTSTSVAFEFHKPDGNPSLTMNSSGTWDYQGNALTGLSQATITNTGSTAGLTVTKSGSGNGITVTNSGSGLAGRFGNIGINANTISSTDTNGNILLTPNGTGYTDVTAGGLRIAGTQRISNAGNATLVNLTTTGTHTHGANARSIELYKTVTLTDATATTIATLTLPTGANLAGLYTVQISGIIQNSASTALTGAGAAIGGQRIDATVTFGQDNGAVSSEGVKTTITLGTLAGDQLGSRSIASATIAVAISGTDNSVHNIQLTVTGSGSTTPPNLNFIGEIKVHRSFTSLTAN
jgi:hypothetical protein